MVSRGYLRAWADENDLVEVIDVEHGRKFKTSITKATVVKHVYVPSVLSVDLENEFGLIESAATPALVKLRNGTQLDENEQRDLIAFLDMHLERGRYANQAAITTPALVIKCGGEFEQTNLKLADRLLLTRHTDGPIRLSKLGLETWPWTLYKGDGIATGDGAVLLWHETKANDLCTVTFPISPSLLLVIGQKIPLDTPINEVLAQKSRRWMIGKTDTLIQDPSTNPAISTSGENHAEDEEHIKPQPIDG